MFESTTSKIGLMGGILAIIGAVSPWAISLRYGVYRGFECGPGMLTLILGLVGIPCMAKLLKKTTVLALGLAIFLVTILSYGIADYYTTEPSERAVIRLGDGVWVSLLGDILLAIGGGRSVDGC
jgi:predicted membrane channel-forming protein YqfA (hemolysin III family)